MLIGLVRLMVMCGSPCSGLVVTSYNKYEPSKKLKEKFFSSINHYKEFKKMKTLYTNKNGKINI